MINGQYVALVNHEPLIVWMKDREITQVMKPDGYKYKPSNPRHISRLKAQAPADDPERELLMQIFGEEPQEEF